MQSTCVLYLPSPLFSLPCTSRALQSTCVQYLLCSLCFFPGISRTLQSTCVQCLPSLLSSFPGATATLQSTFVQYLLWSVFSPWHYLYPSVYFCSLFTMPITYILLPLCSASLYSVLLFFAFTSHDSIAT
jgi:hypothetical protein